jgi:hypothetical protein
VELSDNADGYVIADAVLILPANPLRAAGGAALGASVASLTAEQARPLLAEAARVGKRRAWVGPRRRTCS